MDFITTACTALALFAGLAMSYYMWSANTKPDENEDDVFDMDKFKAMNKAPTAEECNNFGGQTDKYSWTQTNNDLEIRFPVASDVKTKDVDWALRSDYIKLAIRGESLLDGTLAARVVVDDSVWTFDTDGGERTLVWTLQKLEPTEGRAHWKSIAEGQPQIDTTNFGSKIQTVDATDPSSIAKMVAQMK